MILYHGTNADIEAIDLTLGLRYKDFGKGFYLTPNRETACRMALKRARLFGGTATLITYELDDSAMQSDFFIILSVYFKLLFYIFFIGLSR